MFKNLKTAEVYYYERITNFKIKIWSDSKYSANRLAIYAKLKLIEKRYIVSNQMASGISKQNKFVLVLSRLRLFHLLQRKDHRAIPIQPR